VVIATVFLTIIGMTAGYVLGERHHRIVSSDSSGSSPATGPATSNNGSNNGAPNGGSSNGATPAIVPAAPTVAVDGPRCPDAAQKAAAASGSRDLRQIFRIVTDNKTTVWICQDSRGALFYQSHTLVDGQDLPLVQNRNGLFLPGVTRTDNGFQVVDQKGNRFAITRQRLQIFFVDGKVQSDDVAKVEG
jgi:hypothetical protein